MGTFFLFCAFFTCPQVAFSIDLNDLYIKTRRFRHGSVFCYIDTIWPLLEVHIPKTSKIMTGIGNCNPKQRNGNRKLPNRFRRTFKASSDLQCGSLGDLLALCYKCKMMSVVILDFCKSYITNAKWTLNLPESTSHIVQPVMVMIRQIMEIYGRKLRRLPAVGRIISKIRLWRRHKIMLPLYLRTL